MNYADELFDEHYTGRKRDNADRKWYEFYKEIPILDMPEYVPRFIRGATDLSKIWLRKGMDYKERLWVLAHEIAHIFNPFERDENKIDQKAYAFVPAAHGILQRDEKRMVLNYRFA
ncbi:MAG: hypothetical protein V1900_01400 [Candidatus Aenigmatarchaeota archaeon]